jgi:hypothetical protein
MEKIGCRSARMILDRLIRRLVHAPPVEQPQVIVHPVVTTVRIVATVLLPRLLLQLDLTAARVIRINPPQFLQPLHIQSTRTVRRKSYQIIRVMRRPLSDPSRMAGLLLVLQVMGPMEASPIPVWTPAWTPAWILAWTPAWSSVTTQGMIPEIPTMIPAASKTSLRLFLAVRDIIHH